MTTGEGGWSLVWKLSYMEVNLTRHMTYYSSVHKECNNLDAGWCNVLIKEKLHPTDMMIAAYHDNTLVYAYKGAYNYNIDKKWQGGILLPPTKQIEDKCSRKYQPTPIENKSGLSGLIIDKQSSSSHTDTIEGSLADPKDERWEDCQLPRSISSKSQNVQMTMAIYVR
jgi:hypothetical protein